MSYLHDPLQERAPPPTITDRKAAQCPILGIMGLPAVSVFGIEAVPSFFQIRIWVSAYHYHCQAVNHSNRTEIRRQTRTVVLKNRLHTSFPGIFETLAIIEVTGYCCHSAARETADTNIEIRTIIIFVLIDGSPDAFLSIPELSLMSSDAINLYLCFSAWLGYPLFF